MMNSRSSLQGLLALAAIGLAQSNPVSDSVGYVPPKRQSNHKPYVRTLRLDQAQEVRTWNAQVQAKRDAKKARKEKK